MRGGTERSGTILFHGLRLFGLFVQELFLIFFLLLQMLHPYLTYLILKTLPPLLLRYLQLPLQIIPYLHPLTRHLQ